MSSREIAELTGKEHKNVLADIRKMLDELGASSAEFSAVYKDQQLIERPCFNLPKDLTLTLVSGYSVQLRKRIIDRWMELEARNVPDPMAALSDPATMRGLLLTYTEKVISRGITDLSFEGSCIEHYRMTKSLSIDPSEAIFR